MPSPGNDGLTKECYEILWEEIKYPFFLSVKQGFLKRELGTLPKNKLL